MTHRSQIVYFVSRLIVLVVFVLGVTAKSPQNIQPNVNMPDYNGILPGIPGLRG
jgi:hypothetical protein